MTKYEARTLSAESNGRVAKGDCVCLSVTTAEPFMVRKILTIPMGPKTQILRISANGFEVSFRPHTGDLLLPLPLVPANGLVEVVLANNGEPAVMKVGVTGLVAVNDEQA